MKKIILLVFMALASGCYAKEVYLDCSFVKDDLSKVDIFYANEKYGIFAFQLNDNPNDYAHDECANVLPVEGGGVRRLIAGLGTTNYDVSLPLMVLNKYTLIYHTVASISDRPSEKILESRAIRFPATRQDNGKSYLCRQTLWYHPALRKSAVEIRYDPNGHLLSTKEIKTISNFNESMPFDGQPAARVRIEKGDIVLDGRVILKRPPYYRELSYNPTGYFLPHTNSSAKYIVFVDITADGGLLRSHLRYLKLYDTRNGKITILRKTRNAILNPQLSPDANRVLFIEDGWLYLMDVNKLKTQKIDKAKIANWAIHINADTKVSKNAFIE